MVLETGKILVSVIRTVPLFVRIESLRRHAVAKALRHLHCVHNPISRERSRYRRRENVEPTRIGNIGERRCRNTKVFL